MRIEYVGHLSGQDEVQALGLYFARGTVLEVSDDVGKRLLTNPNFHDADLGQNPHFKFGTNELRDESPIKPAVPVTVPFEHDVSLLVPPDASPPPEVPDPAPLDATASEDA